MEKRKATLNASTPRQGTGTGFRAKLPTKWIRAMGLDEVNRNVELEFDGKEIKIRKGAEEGKSQIATWLVDSVKSKADELREKGYTLADIFEVGVKALDKE